MYLSYDIDSIEAGFVPGTGWPEPGGLMPREALKIVNMVAVCPTAAARAGGGALSAEGGGGVQAEGLCGMELVEVSPPYDVSDITALMGLRLIVDVMGRQPPPHPCLPRARTEHAWRSRLSRVLAVRAAWWRTERWARTSTSSTNRSGRSKFEYVV